MFTFFPVFFRFSGRTRFLFIQVFSVLFALSLNAQSMASGPNANYLPTDGACQVMVPPGSYILAESFFQNYDYVMRRVAFLQAYGFKDASYTHTKCQAFDVDLDIYIVTISKPASSKESLYTASRAAYDRAAKNDIKLINTRIVEALR